MIDPLIAARVLMGTSLGFHIIFAVVGMVMPLIMSYAHYKWLKTKDDDYLVITKWWMKGLGIFFATGAVSGTALSFELGLLWPEFMRHAGPIFGMPFSWEGTAFFLEAIFLGLYLYGFKRLKPWVHWWSGVGVGLCGMASGIFIVAANSWMNSPAGFTWIEGKAHNIDPVAAMFNDAWFSQAQHTVITATLAVSLAVLGVHAIFIRKNLRRSLNIKAFGIVLPFFIISSLLTPISGDISAKDVAVRQPLKLAAMEAHFHTMPNAPLVLGGIPDVENETLKLAIELPSLLSVLAFNDPDAVVKGLKDFDKELWPPIAPVHYAFQVMVGIGSYCLVLALILSYLLFKKKDIFSFKSLLIALTVGAPLGFIGIEAGWIVTELGRQPWIIYGVMKVKDAVTPMPGVEYMLITFCSLYFTLALMVTWLMWRQFKFFMKTEI